MMSYYNKDTGPICIACKSKALLDSYLVTGDTTELQYNVFIVMFMEPVCDDVWVMGQIILEGVIIGLFIMGKLCWSKAAL